MHVAMADEAEAAAGAAAGDPVAAEPDTAPAREIITKPEKFMGVFDINTPVGVIGASLVVSVGFCLVVETIKFFDPSTTSIFEGGSFV